MEYLWKYIATWSRATFGSDKDRGPLGPLNHLKKEVDEVILDPLDLYEYADCLILIFDAARRAGFTYEDLQWAAIRKMDINTTRRWPAVSGDEVAEHIKDSKDVEC